MGGKEYVTMDVKDDSNQNKPRIYLQVAGHPGIAKVRVWNEELQKHVAPLRGGAFEARRRELMPDGRRKRVKRSFDTLQEARNFVARISSEVAPEILIKEKAAPKGRLLAEVIEEWQRRIYPTLAESTRIAYDKIIRLYFGPLMGLGVLEITSGRVDTWIDWLKDPKGRAMQSSRRYSFDHELSLLGTVLKYYREYHDDPLFFFPVKQRHHEAVVLNRPKQPKPKDLTEEELVRFVDELRKGPNGEHMAAMATVQFFQALRVSEVAALHWEDISFDFADLKNSRVRFAWYVFWPRRKGLVSEVRPGFKNSKSNAGIKEQPLFPEACEALMRLYSPDAKGLVFNSGGGHFEYRQVQYAYDRAFRKAGLPYTATHVMRHGGCRAVYNEVSDIEVAKQHLGNSSMQTVAVYAKRSATALTNVVHKRWDRYEAGRKWSQKEA